MANTEMLTLYANYIKRSYKKNDMVTVRKVSKYNWGGLIHVAVHHVEDNGDIIAYSCHGEYWCLSCGDTFAHYIPHFRSSRS